MLRNILDVVAAAVVTVGAPIFRTVGNWPGNYPLYRRQADRMRVHWRSTHYYHPTYRNDDLPKDVTAPRDLPGLDLNEQGQLAIIKSLNFQDELATLTLHDDPALAYTYDNNQYGAGDADSLYAMVRQLKPRRLFEIGSGHSTRVAAKALARNAAEDSSYSCRHVCIEPYEMPWLEKLGPEILRQRVEEVPLALFSQLDAGDILFIDSSHVIRPFGDVLVEFLSIVPSLRKGVVVHVHDIFTPFDYPEKWLRDDRRLWNEQYLLETMLAHSSRYRVLLAMNWLANFHPDLLDEKFPARLSHAHSNAAFWFAVAA